MDTHDDMVEGYGKPIRTESIPCVTSQWNHPVAHNRPFVDRFGYCAICRQTVEWEQHGPDDPNLYSRVAVPHNRTERWFAVRESDLRVLEDRW